MNTNHSPTTTYAIKPSARYRIIDDEAMIVNQNSANLYLCNELGSFVLDRIRDGNRNDDIVNAICQEYDTDPETARRDLEEFLDALIAIDTLEITTDR